MNLEEGLRRLPLHGLHYFSSISGSLGNPGQANYAAANAALDALACHRASQARAAFPPSRAQRSKAPAPNITRAYVLGLSLSGNAPTCTWKQQMLHRADLDLSTAKRGILPAWGFKPSRPEKQSGCVQGLVGNATGWGPWAGAGMAAADAQLLQRLSRQGPCNKTRKPERQTGQTSCVIIVQNILSVQGASFLGAPSCFGAHVTLLK